MDDETVDYCEQRMLEEKHAAARASCPEAAYVHEHLAQEFAKRANALRLKAKSMEMSDAPGQGTKSAIG